MKHVKVLLPILILVILGMAASRTPRPGTWWSFETPAGWPEPVYDFSRNPLDSNKIFLGRKLFYEPKLSADNTISCASCHLSYTAFTHVDHALSHGIRDSVGTRNSPALIVNPTAGRVAPTMATGTWIPARTLLAPHTIWMGS